MDFNTVFFIILAFNTYFVYLSSTRQTESLQQIIKALQGKIAQVEKSTKRAEPQSIALGNAELAKEFIQLKDNMSTLQAEIDRLESLLEAYKTEDQEDKLCLIEGMKAMGKFLGQDSLSVEAEEDAPEDGQNGEGACKKKVIEYFWRKPKI
jgi:septal ring factor EnvC (AmiA/AmiB activator)